MPIGSDRRIEVRRLGALPVVAHFANRLGIQEIVDRCCPSGSDAHLTHGQVALAIVLNRLTAPGGLHWVVDWAREWALAEVCGIDGALLNDDRLGRCLDAIYPQLKRIQGEVALAAVREFDLKLDQLHGDDTAVVLQGEYPEYAEEPSADDPPLASEPPPPHPRYDCGGQADCKQYRVLEIGTLDGMIPLWHRIQDGSKAESPEGVGAVIAEMDTLRKHLPVPGCAIVGDSELLTQTLLPGLRRTGWGFLAPLGNTAVIDRQYLALPEDGWKPLDYSPRRAANKPEEEKSLYTAQELKEEWTNPETGQVETFRKLFVRSSARAARDRRLRLQRVARADKELHELVAALPGRARRMSPAALEARALRILEKHKVSPCFSVKAVAGDPCPLLEWEVLEEELAQQERLDGCDVLYTSLAEETAPPLEILRRWKQQGELERRFSDWKGPLLISPVFLKTPRRIAALILLLHLALMIFCLIEREARRRLKEQGLVKLPNLLAGHVAAVPTGQNILGAFENSLLVAVEGHEGRETGVNNLKPEQDALWKLLDLGSPAWA